MDISATIPLYVVSLVKPGRFGILYPRSVPTSLKSLFFFDEPISAYLMLELNKDGNVLVVLTDHLCCIV